ncbi:phytanoyl-CoA dioxygenase family protein [Sulfurovum sp. NBC37-1]|uniref:phytanoyl-CoA dioxygenase family protein n=1 Tax=Sulfurovum sp. (strain NBC37-1) TaxID=387093 RepID=UPI0001587584|nr:phytanoyl-CoA dioxygenase family protein [Sulfurovum sp. NBC37-1]BAF71192.1 phytanoyl-CoA dioxygenase, PhyH family [Sulfurovum sp. NBC37-1]
MRLTEEALQNFEANGFLLLPQFADHELCDTIRDIALAHLKHKVPPVETEFEYIAKSKEERERISDAHSEQVEKHITVRRLRQVYHRDIVFKQWMENEKIRPVLKQILGEAPAITISHHNSIMTKMPHTSTETSWHQDFRYWHFETDNLVSVWLALDEENSDNGVLEFIPGSHKMNFIPSQFDEKEYFSDSHKENEEIIAKKVSYPLQKGDVVLFHCKLLHRANRNSTDEPKISFVYTVKGCSNKAIEGTRSSEFKEVPLT